MYLFEEFKEYKIVNGKLIEDIDLKTTKDNKQQVTTGYINNKPVYIKKQFNTKQPKLKNSKIEFFHLPKKYYKKRISKLKHHKLRKTHKPYKQLSRRKHVYKDTKKHK